MTPRSPANPIDPRGHRHPARRGSGGLRSVLALLLLLGTGCDPSAPEPNGPSTRVETPTDPHPRGSVSLIHPGGRISAEQAHELAALESREQEAEATIWAPEIVAQRCGRTIEGWWDALNKAPLTNRLALVAQWPVGEVIPPVWDTLERLPHDIERRAPRGPGQPIPPDRWRQIVESAVRDGWQLLQVELRHVRFDPRPSGEPGTSEFLFTAHLVHATRPDRATLAGTIAVDWGEPEPGEDRVPIRRADARSVTLDTRTGPLPFEPILAEPIETARDSSLIDPLIVHDLDGDGFPEIVLAGRNLVFRRQRDGTYRSGPLLQQPAGPLLAAVLGDFDGDGAVDLLAMKWEALVLFHGSPDGQFREAARSVWPAPADLRYAMAITSGDVDEDGDLDVFLAQYKVPYEGGSMPTPFHDANDGHPAHLLLNDGHGQFTDATASSGLAPKSRRRTYSTSFVDLDGDGHLDLVVVSDFAGVDVYQGDGRGHFVDRTERWIPERWAFGMAHTFADFNRDGRLDLLMMGMGSPTAERLEHLGLQRPGPAADLPMRARMTHGSRLYLAQAQGGFAETDLSRSIARTGWSWGCSAFDLENDGFPEVYIATGLESRESVRDYEGEYWLHDLHAGESAPNPTAYLYFMTKFSRTRGRGQSYGGYEKNRFYLNLGGSRFVEVGHLFGLGSEADSRNVVAADLDGDGRGDLVLTTYQTWPDARQVVRAYRNVLPSAGHWIGFRFSTAPRRLSPAGARVELRSADFQSVQVLATGDSHRSQHPDTIQFGLGALTRVDSAIIRWPGGPVSELKNPPVDRYLEIPAPALPR